MSEIFMRDIRSMDYEKIKNELSTMRLEKISRLKNKRAAMLSAAVELALNDAVKAVCMAEKAEYKYDKNGKPYLTELPYHISLSHSGDIAVCAISDVEIGVDIQKIKAPDMRIVKRFFTKTEQRYVVEAEDRNKAFNELWVKKEACVKLIGTGIDSSFSSLCVIGNKNYDFEMYDIGDDGYSLCVCCGKLYNNS